MNTAKYEDLALLIDGQFVVADARQEGEDVVNPSTMKVLGRLPHAEPADLDRALASAQKAFDAWRCTSPVERSTMLRRVAALLRERAPGIAANITQDMGKPLEEASGEVGASAEVLEWHAEECRRIYGRIIPARQAGVRQTVLYQPVGVCAAFSPWNFPLLQAVRKVAAALGSGCTVILKGPETAPSAAVAMARAFQDAGLPAGVLNLVWGVPEEVSRHLITSSVVRKVTFTGSVPVGKHLAALAGQYMKRTTMELGGHAPVIVFDDADVDSAIAVLAKMKLRNAGQVCVSPTRFFVQQGVLRKFGDQLASAFAGMRIGDGLDPRTQIGPLGNARRVTAMEELVDDARRHGASILSGGQRLEKEGHFFEPTLVSGAPDTSKLMTEEPFGPIAAVTGFRTVDEVMKRANALPYGLAGYVFTQSLRTAARVSEELEVGCVGINHSGIGLPETPFGGIKDSGHGSEGGTETFHGYLTTKLISQA